MAKSVIHQRRYELIAHAAPGDGTLMPVEAEARNLPDRRTGRNRAGAKMGIKAVQQMGSVGSEKPCRGAMPNAILEKNQIFGIGIIELIDFEFSGQDRQVPFQKVDENLLSSLEHRPQCASFIDFHILNYLLLHDFLHVGPVKKTSAARSRYPNKWGWQALTHTPSPRSRQRLLRQRKMSAKPITPSNKAHKIKDARLLVS
jgi:hypothetical protein